MRGLVGSHQIAVIGAGMAGLTAARDLQAAGLDVVIFEKSRGVGGRMSTRRMDALAFDHGAQYMTVRGAYFAELLKSSALADAVAPWGPKDAGRFVGTPSMNALPRALAAGLTVQTERTVKALERVGDGWRLDCAEGRDERLFDAVLLTAPAAQTLALLPADSELRGPVEHVRYAPCWTVMLSFDTASSAAIPDSQRPLSGPIAWAARNSRKPGRDSSPENWVIHATAEWTRAHLQDPAPQVIADLLAAFREITGHIAEPTIRVGHRWLYALVEQSAGVDHLWSPAMRVGAAGDWCIGPRVEAAVESGHALALSVIKTLLPKG